MFEIAWEITPDTRLRAYYGYHQVVISTTTNYCLRLWQFALPSHLILRSTKSKILQGDDYD